MSLLSKKSKTKPVKDETAPAANNAAATSLPLFFRDPYPLDAKRHQQAHVHPSEGYGFARETNSLPVNAIEFIEAAKHYPIVFTMGENPTAVVLVGLERQNYCIDENGQWKDGMYVPAYARQYPFVFFERPEEKKFYLCIDEGADVFSKTKTADAAPLYTTEGTAAPITNNALQFCTAYYQHYQITRNLCADLHAHKLLVPYHSEVQISPEKKIGLSGFQMIDEKALAQLPDAVFLEFRQKGWLPFIYLALSSTSNWKRLVDLASGKNRQAASKVA